MSVCGKELEFNYRRAAVEWPIIVKFAVPGALTGLLPHRRCGWRAHSSCVSQTVFRKWRFLAHHLA